jgi:hypothetical protein
MRQMRKWKGKEREILETRAPKPTPSFWGMHARPAEGAQCASPPHFASEGSDTIDVDNLRTTRESHIYHMPDFSFVPSILSTGTNVLSQRLVVA